MHTAAGHQVVRQRSAAWLAAGLGCYLGLLAADRSRVVVRGPSMSPSLLPGDVLLTVPVAGPLRARATPGRVVLVADPEDDAHLLVKRVIAADGGRLWLEGDDPAHSTDSRRWGWVPRARVRRLALRRWPQLRTPLWRDPWRPPRVRAGVHAQRRAMTSTSGSSSATSPAPLRP